MLVRNSWLPAIALQCALFAVPLHGQLNTGDASALLTATTQAFAGKTSVHKVQLTGSATWLVGTKQDQGPVTFIVDSTGSATMQLSLQSRGTWSETQDPVSASMSCSWMGQDNKAHIGSSVNCLRPVAWVIPDLTMQLSQTPAGVGYTDLGTGTVGSGGESYRHLQVELVLPDLSPDLFARVQTTSVTDVGFDPGTLLPAVVTYSLSPDNGAPSKVQVEIHYTNYREVEGVQVPFTIERYVNGALQLTLQISSAQIS